MSQSHTRKLSEEHKQKLREAMQRKKMGATGGVGGGGLTGRPVNLQPIAADSNPLGTFLAGSANWTPKQIETELTAARRTVTILEAMFKAWQPPERAMGAGGSFPQNNG